MRAMTTSPRTRRVVLAVLTTTALITSALLSTPALAMMHP